MTLIKKTLCMIAATFWGLAASSCSSTEGQEPETPRPVHATFSIFSSSMSRYTRTDLGESPTLDNELIKTWYVAFVRDGKVVAVETGTPGGVWSDPIKTVLPAGSKYSVYAFANIPDDYMQTTLGLVEGATVIHQDLMTKTFDSSDGVNCFANDTDIPMAGYIADFTVKGTVSEDFAIEVVRLYSKVEFAFVRRCESSVEVESIELSEVNEGNILLMPDYEKKPKPDTLYPEYDPAFPDGVTWKPAVQTFSSSPILVKEDKGGDDWTRTHFYIKESLAEWNVPTGRFHIRIGIRRGDEGVADNVYALADESLKFFYRNDYVLFPIVLTDRTPDFEIRSYPPIGGYAATITERNHDFYATFDYGGDFEVRAFMRQGVDEVEDDAISIKLTEIVDPDNILEYSSFTPSSIGGKNGFSNIMKFGANGTAVLTFEITDRSVTPALTYIRNVYLIKNPEK